MSGLDQKGTSFPNGISVPESKFWLGGVLVTATAAILNAIATLAGTQTLTNKTLTAPVINSPDTTQGVSSHDYGAAAADWALSAAEMKISILIATNASGAVNAIATPTAGKVYTVVNTSGQALTFKATGQTGVTIASTKTAIVRGNGTDFVRVTVDA